MEESWCNVAVDVSSDALKRNKDTLIVKNTVFEIEWLFAVIDIVKVVRIAGEEYLKIRE